MLDLLKKKFLLFYPLVLKTTELSVLSFYVNKTHNVIIRALWP